MPGKNVLSDSKSGWRNKWDIFTVVNKRTYFGRKYRNEANRIDSALVIVTTLGVRVYFKNAARVRLYDVPRKRLTPTLTADSIRMNKTIVLMVCRTQIDEAEKKQHVALGS